MLNTNNENTETSMFSLGNQSRRQALGTAAKFGAMAGIPAIFANLLKPDQLAARSAAVRREHNMPLTDILNYALTLEYLEYEFYRIGTNTSGLIPATDAIIFGTIRNHELAHVRFLEGALGLSEDENKPTFDFTAGGSFPDVFSNYATFTALAQAFEDTGVRAYKGQAAGLQNQADARTLTAGLQIHSVEARHASEIRRLNGGFDEEAPQKGWITGSMSGVVPDSAGSAIYGAGSDASAYPAEDNVTQGGVDLTTLTYTPALDGDQALTISEAFDEPLDSESVLAVASLFIES